MMIAQKVFSAIIIRIRSNIKARSLLERILEDSRVEKVSLKPTILRWIRPEEMSNKIAEESNTTTLDPCDPCDICDPVIQGVRNQKVVDVARNQGE